ncbi:hypothetical protein ACFXK0_12675 [Nocardia sp. NPDC059177]|uniref:hypothetical protein n=1 Tax=Nocardia sp. NPDC059177 TaxID=3346759 RepID=UPI0036762145
MMSYSDLPRPMLARLVPELQLSGQLIDRSGMAHLIAAFGREVMADVGVEEWISASPVYTARMRTALGLDGDGVEDMFKCMQLDIGAPPQFMDFRYSVTDTYHGGFELNHCGALIDVEPLGDDYVTAMCHHIEDPTFDATAIATNRRARIRPLHRPPRRPADRHPHCAWTVTIEPDRDELPLPEQSIRMSRTRAAQVELSAIDPTEEGRTDYRGHLLADLRFADWSHSALVRICEELALQHQLLAIGFTWAVGNRTDAEHAATLSRKQLTGIAGLTAGRLRACLGLGTDATSLATVLQLHPVLGPTQYTGITATRTGAGTEAGVLLRIPASSGAIADDGWPARIDAEHLDPVLAIAAAVDPTWSALRASADDTGLTIEIGRGPAGKELGEVAITRFSSGATFEFADRGIPLAITPTGASRR